ncbi:hypothetical protein [Streptomyces albus]|uniref:hypothetical protein n=1 Tax=Streptomyces albus TaxID=1888 RepID=UPI0034566B95
MNAANGSYMVDEATEQLVPPAPPWVGRLLQSHRDGTVLLIAPTGYAWTAAANDLRPATEDERAAYDAQVREVRRERAALYRQLSGGSRS